MKHPLAGIICQSLNDRVAHFFNQSCSRLLRYLRATTQHGCRLDKREQYKRKQNDKSQLFRPMFDSLLVPAGHFRAQYLCPLTSDKSPCDISSSFSSRSQNKSLPPKKHLDVVIVESLPLVSAFPLVSPPRRKTKFSL